MLGLLLDECMSPRLPGRFYDYGIYAVHVRDRGMLGSADHVVWELAQHEMLALCTINGGDFRKLAKRGAHSGLLVIPSGGNTEQQFRWTSIGILRALRSNSGGALANRYIEVSDDCDIAASEYDDLHSLH